MAYGGIRTRGDFEHKPGKRERRKKSAVANRIDGDRVAWMEDDVKG